MSNSKHIFAYNSSMASLTSNGGAHIKWVSPGLKVTDKPGIEYNADCSQCSCYGQCYLTPGRDLITHYLDMTRGKLSGDIVDLRYLNTIQSNIHEQWQGHYQGNDQRRLFTARWCYSTLEIIRTFCKSHLTGHTSSPLNLVCGVPAINALWLGLKLNKQKYVWLNSWSPSVWAVSGVSGRCVKLHPLLVPSYNIITTCAAQWNVMTTASNLLLYTLDIMLCMLGICQWIACFWYVRGS